MYLQFYGLREAPFSPTPDPKFLYQSTRHREALAQLIYGVRERKGFIVLTGEIGTGKTTLLRTWTPTPTSPTCTTRRWVSTACSSTCSRTGA